MADTIKARISGRTGDVIVGKDITVTTTGRAARARPRPSCGPMRSTGWALERATPDGPADPAAMSRVRDWLQANVPARAGAVVGLVGHPLAGKLVEAAGVAAVAGSQALLGAD